MNDEMIFSKHTPERLRNEYLQLRAGIKNDKYNEYDKELRLTELVKHATIIHNSIERAEQRKKRNKLLYAILRPPKILA